MVKLIVAMAGAAVLALYPLAGVKAAIVFDDASPALQVAAAVQETTDGQSLLNRGEAVSKVVAAFDLEKKQKKFLLDCLGHPDDCFFVFSTMSHFDDIRFTPLILYPDVFPAYKFYGAINTASMLGLVHGYLEEDTSPFHPETGMTRIQALKVVLGAADAIKWIEKFELKMAAADSGGPDYALPYGDVDPQNDSMWWYPRYLGFALDNNIIDPGDYFRPDETVTEAELNDMMTRALNYASADENQTVAQAKHNGQAGF